MNERVSAEQLRITVGELFHRAGMSQAHAATMADAIVYTDSRGIYSHGTAKVGTYLEWLTNGMMNPRAEPVLSHRRGAAATVDAQNGLGHVACVFGMEQATQIAREQGVGIVAIANSNHCGALSYYPERAIDAGMIGIAMTNALPTMAPWGGVDRIVGINPISIGFPAGTEENVLLDSSFGAVARGKIVVHYENGLPLPEGWAFDKLGKPTTDAVEAMEGLNQPIGGAKGVGMGMVFGMLPALLASAAYGSGLGDLASGPKPGRDGQLMIAIDVSAFVPPAQFVSATDDIVREVHESRRMTGVDHLYVPGEPESETARRCAVEGIPIDRASRKVLRHWLQEFDVTADWLEETSGS